MNANVKKSWSRSNSIKKGQESPEKLVPSNFLYKRNSDSQQDLNNDLSKFVGQIYTEGPYFEQPIPKFTQEDNDTTLNQEYECSPKVDGN